MPHEYGGVPGCVCVRSFRSLVSEPGIKPVANSHTPMMYQFTFRAPEKAADCLGIISVRTHKKTSAVHVRTPLARYNENITIET